MCRAGEFSFCIEATIPSVDLRPHRFLSKGKIRRAFADLQRMTSKQLVFTSQLVCKPKTLFCLPFLVFSELQVDVH